MRTFSLTSCLDMKVGKKIFGLYAGKSDSSLLFPNPQDLQCCQRKQESNDYCMFPRDMHSLALVDFKIRMSNYLVFNSFFNIIAFYTMHSFQIRE